MLSLLRVLVAQLLLANGIFILAPLLHFHSQSLLCTAPLCLSDFLSNPVLRVFAASKWVALMQPLKQIITKVRSKIQTES